MFGCLGLDLEPWTERTIDVDDEGWDRTSEA